MAAILYGEAFGRQRPKDAVATLSARSKRTHTLGESFTDHLRARAEAEEVYSKVRLAGDHSISTTLRSVVDKVGTDHRADTVRQALFKLARKPIVPEHVTLDKGADKVRKRLEAELNELARAHEALAKRIQAELVPALATATNVGEADLRSQELGATGAAKDFDDAAGRVAKASAKAGANPAKLQAAEADLQRATRMWRSTVGPSLFVSHAQVDSVRLEGVKEQLAKYATMQSDIARERLEAAERALVDVIGWEVDEDAAEWMRREGGGSEFADQPTSSRSPVETNAPRQSAAAVVPPASSAFLSAAPRALTLIAIWLTSQPLLRAMMTRCASRPCTRIAAVASCRA